MALIEIRHGNWEAAHGLQASIESTLEGEPAGRSQIRYLNTLNTGRATTVNGGNSPGRRLLPQGISIDRRPAS